MVENLWNSDLVLDGKLGFTKAFDRIYSNSLFAALSDKAFLKNTSDSSVSFMTRNLVL